MFPQPTLALFVKVSKSRREACQNSSPEIQTERNNEKKREERERGEIGMRNLEGQSERNKEAMENNRVVNRRQ